MMDFIDLIDHKYGCIVAVLSIGLLFICLSILCFGWVMLVIITPIALVIPFIILGWIAYRAKWGEK